MDDETPLRSRGRHGRRAAADDELDPPVAVADEAPGEVQATDEPAQDEAGTSSGARRTLHVPLVPALLGLLVLLVAAAAFLFLTRPGSSAVRTDSYVPALQAARAGIVDVASFDYLTLDDDIEQIRQVTTGDLQGESVDQLDANRQQITDSQTVVNTEVVGAAVGAASEDSATVYLVIQSTQQSSASPQAQVLRYRIEVDMTQVDGRWLMSGITGR